MEDLHGIKNTFLNSPTDLDVNISDNDFGVKLPFGGLNTLPITIKSDSFSLQQHLL